jgi:hypothetical protein
MRKSLMVLVGLAGAAAFAGAAQAGDAMTKQDAAGYEGCGFGQAYLQAQTDDAAAAEKAALRARLETLIDEALKAEETAAAPVATKASNSGS